MRESFRVVVFSIVMVDEESRQSVVWTIGVLFLQCE